MKTQARHIWSLLGRVRSLQLAAATGDRCGFFHNAAAAGSVTVLKTDNRLLVFQEAGTWTSANRQTVDFRNIYQWSLQDPPETIGLIHLRYGFDHPVHLVSFVAAPSDRMQSSQPHCCGADRYSAILSASEDRIFLDWRIRGPKKDDRLCCTYFIS